MNELTYVSVAVPGPIRCLDIRKPPMGKSVGTMCPYPVLKDSWCIDLSPAGRDLHENQRCYPNLDAAKAAVTRLLKG